MTSIGVVTPSRGGATLQRAIDSVAAQTVACTHYVFLDGVDPPPNVTLPPNARLCKLPARTGFDMRLDCAIVAASTYLLAEECVVWLDEQNWMEPRHVQTLIEAKGDKPFAYALRRLFTADGEFFADDNALSLGLWSGFVDLNCYLIDRLVAVRLAPLLYRSAEPGVDGEALMFEALKQSKIEHTCTGEYTLNYTLPETPDLRGKIFQANIMSRSNHPDGFPWALETK